MQWFFAIIPAYPRSRKRPRPSSTALLAASVYLTTTTNKEVGRFRSPLWLSTPHATSEDFVYGDQFIPKDTVVLLNTWTMQHDPVRHPNPYEFDVRIPSIKMHI